MASRVCFFSILAIAHGVRLNHEARGKVSSLERKPIGHTPIGLLIDRDVMSSLMAIMGVLGEGGQSTVYEGFIGNAAAQQGLEVEHLKSLEAMADDLIAANDSSQMMSSQNGALFNFIDQHYDRIGAWSFEANKSHMREAKSVLQEIIEAAERELHDIAPTAVDTFDAAVKRLESKANPYVPDFGALQGQRVAIKMSSADDEDEAMLFKEVVFGHVLRSASGDTWKVGGFLGFVCVDMGEPNTNQTSDETEELCFSRFCPHGTAAFIFMEKFGGKPLFEQAVHFDNDVEARSFVKSISDAVSSMHDHGVTHGDLAQRNVMFDKGTVSIIDLGYAKFCGHEAFRAATAKFADSGLFQGVIDSDQCHFDGEDKEESMLSHTESLGFLEDGEYLEQWLPDMVQDKLDRSVVIAEIPSDDC